MKAVAGLFCVFTRVASAALSTDPFVYDPQFNAGIVVEDRFAATSTDTADLGLSVAIGANGDVIASGIVGPAYTAAAPGGNFGSVRYGSDGARISWTSPTAAFSYYFDRYIDYPNLSGDYVSWVDDVKVFRGYMYVLVGIGPANGNRDVYVLTFTEGGAFVGTGGVATPAFNTGLDETGAALVPYCEHELVVNGVPQLHCNLIAVANYWTGSRSVITMKRFAINSADGSLAVSDTFGISNNGAMDQAAPDSLCDAGTNCSWSVAAATAVRTDDNHNPTLYLAGTVNTSATQTDGVVIAVDGYSGARAISFGGGSGIFVNYLPASGGGTAITASTLGDAATDVVFLAENTFESCGQKGTVTKLRAQAFAVGGPQTLPDYYWGNGGTRDVGGNQGACISAHTFLRDMVLDDERLVLVGYEDIASTIPDPLFSIIRVGDGALTWFERAGFTPRHSDGSPWGGASFQSVAARGAGRYAVSGWLYDASAGNATLFGTASLVSDRIFGNDFE